MALLETEVPLAPISVILAKRVANCAKNPRTDRTQVPRLAFPAENFGARGDSNGLPQGSTLQQ
jgi:hypothetical protein